MQIERVKADNNNIMILLTLSRFCILLKVMESEKI